MLHVWHKKITITNILNMKTLEDFNPKYSCKVGKKGWHELGCPHQEWRKKDFTRALDNVKRENIYLRFLLEEHEKEKK